MDVWRVMEYNVFEGGDLFLTPDGALLHVIHR